MVLRARRGARPKSKKLTSQNALVGGRVHRAADARNAAEYRTGSGHVEPAIGVHNLASDEAGAVRGEKNDDLGDVSGLGHRTQRYKARLFKHLGLAELVARLCRVGKARGDSIDANTMRGECQGHGAG